jgi:aldehyde:ferredoxin oxidoreductase
VYLWICDGAVELKDAQGLWGLETGPALDAIREELGQPEARIASSAACVNSELAHVNDRSAMGAVMGSKNLKAVAVRGEPAKLSFADPAAVQELDARHRKALKERMPGLNPGTCGMPMHGPLGILESPKPLDCGPDKVRWFKAGQLTRAMSSTLGICNFAVRPVFALTYDRLVAVAGALTGWDTSLHELLLGAERAIVLARMFDVREGLTRQDDCLCRRLREALPAVRPAEEGPDEAGFRAALALYYEMMGWDEEGVPRRGKLLDLNLGWLAARGAGSAEKAV